MKFFHKIDNFLSCVEIVMIVCLYAGLVVLIALSIFMRLFFQSPTYRLLEIGPAMVLWLALTGGSLAVRKQSHIRLEFFLRFCSAGVVKWSWRAVGIFGMLSMGVLGWASTEFVTNEVEIFGSRGWSSLIFPLFFGITAFRFCIQAIVPGSYRGKLRYDSKDKFVDDGDHS